MRIFALSIVLVALVACGGSDKADSGSDAAGDMAGKAAAGGEHTDHMEAPKAPAAAPAGSGTPGAAILTGQRCRDLIAKGEFQAALTPCLAALNADPSNTELQEAVAKARASKAGMQDGAADAADAAADSAGAMADDAAEKFKAGANDAASALD